MTLRMRLPAGGDVEVDAVLDELTSEPTGGRLVLGDERIREFLAAVGKRLLAGRIVRSHPELGSLARFLRQCARGTPVADLPVPQGALRFPRGLIFHLPPSNVDTVFVYSWALAAVTGNHNIVRISPRMTGVTQTVLSVLNEALADSHPAVAQTQKMVTYGHDSAVSAALSSACDLRVVWGGDGSIHELRRIPLPPTARDLTFPDRTSFAVLSADTWRNASPASRRSVAEGLYNDVYWFGQAACSSPRVHFWVGGADAVADAKPELEEQLAAVVARRAPDVGPPMAVRKYVAAYGLAAAAVATGVRFPSNATTYVDLTEGVAVLRHWLGTGTFVWGRLERLADLARIVQRRDQTVSYFGFAADELLELARACGGRGVDRIVPVGRALEFAPVWDGYDLVNEFTRLTTVAVR